jgi:quercetin dioxygenase-like cupin family protein
MSWAGMSYLCEHRAMPAFIRLYTDDDGTARLQDWDVALTPEAPAVDQLGASAPLAASALLFVRAPAGGGHGQQPEARRQLAIVLSGECEVTASGETRVGRPGDVLLIEDTAGEGHSSHTGNGFTAAMIVLD